MTPEDCKILLLQSTGVVFRITSTFDELTISCRQSLKTVTSSKQNLDIMRRFSVLVFSSCLALSLCSGFSSFPSQTNHSKLVNRKENCQKVSKTTRSQASDLIRFDLIASNAMAYFLCASFLGLFRLEGSRFPRKQTKIRNRGQSTIMK